MEARTRQSVVFAPAETCAPDPEPLCASDGQTYTSECAMVRTGMQRGIDLSMTLDVSYMSSLSWYFILMFGLQGVYGLVLGNDTEGVDGTQTEGHVLLGDGGVAVRVRFENPWLGEIH